MVRVVRSEPTPPGFCGHCQQVAAVRGQTRTTREEINDYNHCQNGKYIEYLLFEGIRTHKITILFVTLTLHGLGPVFSLPGTSVI